MSNKLGLNLSKNYSINFDLPKRDKKKIIGKRTKKIGV